MPRKCGNNGVWYQGSEKGGTGRETRMWNLEDKFYLSQIYVSESCLYIKDVSISEFVNQLIY